LKDDVGRYLDEVLAGEEVVIKDRNKPVARIIPFSANGEPDSHGDKPVTKRKARSPRKSLPLKEAPLPLTDEELEAHVLQMAAEGKIRLGKGPLDPEFWTEPLADFGDLDVVRFISEDRDED
jgi:antitoxin (DNA-binding transcriptional repressor) of toxin-antitoxin stability system